MPRRITGVKWRVQFNGTACIAAYRGPDRCRLFRESDMSEIAITAAQKLEVDALVDAGAPLIGMNVVR